MTSDRIVLSRRTEMGERFRVTEKAFRVTEKACIKPHRSSGLGLGSYP
jgi:hypothetical protein